MKGRVLWFVAGTTAGVYGSFKARRLADRFTPTAVADQVAAWQLGARAFAEEFRAGMAERESEIAEQLGLPVVGDPPARSLDLPARSLDPAARDGAPTVTALPSPPLSLTSYDQ